MLFRSPYPDVAIPVLPYPDFILQHAGERADRAVLVDGPTGRTLTMGQVAAGARRVASSLARRGFGKGDVLAIYSPNLPEYALAFHSAALVGGIVSPPPTRSPPPASSAINSATPARRSWSPSPRSWTGRGRRRTRPGDPRA